MGEMEATDGEGNLEIATCRTCKRDMLNVTSPRLLCHTHVTSLTHSVANVAHLVSHPGNFFIYIR